MNKIFKRFLFMLLLLLSPLGTIAILAAIYIAFMIISGLGFSEAITSFKAIIYNLKPYYLYLTLIPATLYILAQPIKNKIGVHILRK